jgi:hypothetical protein
MSQKELWFQSFQTAPNIFSREFIPGSSGSLRLDQFASLFEFYRVLSCRISYRTASATTSQGMVHGGVSFDASKNFVDPLSVSYLDPGFRGPIWSDQTLSVPPDRINRLKWTPTSHSSASPTVSAGFEFWLALQSNAPADSLVGEIWIDYDIEFMSPYTIQATLPFATHPLYLSTVTQTFNTVAGGYTIASPALNPLTTDTHWFEENFRPDQDFLGIPIGTLQSQYLTGAHNYSSPLTFHTNDSFLLSAGVWKITWLTLFEGLSPDPLTVFRDIRFSGFTWSTLEPPNFTFSIGKETTAQEANSVIYKVTLALTLTAPPGSLPSWTLSDALTLRARFNGLTGPEPPVGTISRLFGQCFLSPLSPS